MKCLILGAGLGNRLRPLTADLPKPLMPVLNRPLILWLLLRLDKADITEVFVNTHYLSEVLTSELVEYSKILGIKITTRFEPDLRGPAGSMLTFVDAFGPGEDILVISGDVVTDLDFQQMTKQHINSDDTLTVAVTSVKGAGRYGVATVADSRITSFVEKPDLPESELFPISCGIYCINSSLVKDFPDHRVYDFGADLIPKMISESVPVGAFESDFYWNDVGSSEALLQANLDAALGTIVMDDRRLDLPSSLHERSSIPEGIYIDETVTLADEVNLIGPTVIGANALIGARSQLKSCMVFEDGVVSAGHSVESSIVYRDEVIKLGEKQ